MILIKESYFYVQSAHKQFRDLAWKCGLAATHQRQVIYDVRRRIPSISLATVYNNLRLFVKHGLLREVSPRTSALLVEGNLEPHHHLVCTRCKAVQDIEGDFINFKQLSRQAPRGFDLTQPLVEVFGLCRRCSAKT
jgi:Fur family transcriptional regulator, peroxide stress response regulator